MKKKPHDRVSCTLFTALGSGSMNFLSSLFRDQFDLEQFIVDVSIKRLSLLKIDRHDQHSNSFRFFKSSNRIWLTAEVSCS